MTASSRRAGAVLGSAVLAAAVLSASACGGSEPAPTAAPATTVGTTAAPATTAPTTTTMPTTTTSMPPPLPEPSAAIASPGSNKVLIVGDSVTLGAQASMPKALVGWNVIFDAHENRLIGNGLDVVRGHKAAADKAAADDRARVVQAYADAGLPPPPAPPPPTLTDVIGRVAVIHLCTNYGVGGGFASFIDSITTALGDLDRVVWVTCAEWSPGQVEANDAIRASVARHPTIVVADWARYSPTPGYTYEDGIHLQQPGRDELAALVARAVGPAPVPPPAPPPTTLPPPTTTTTTAPPPPAPEPSPAPA